MSQGAAAQIRPNLREHEALAGQLCTSQLDERRALERPLGGGIILDGHTRCMYENICVAVLRMMLPVVMCSSQSHPGGAGADFDDFKRRRKLFWRSWTTRCNPNLFFPRPPRHGCVPPVLGVQNATEKIARPMPAAEGKRQLAVCHRELISCGRREHDVVSSAWRPS